MAVTSHRRSALIFGEADLRDWRDAGLLKPSVIKPVIATLEQALVVKILGRLSEHDQAVLKNVMSQIIG